MATLAEIKSGENIALIENTDKSKLEWIAFESVSYDSGADT
ncbi:hypothetical protein [Pseudoalteromonas sp. NBT06-2]|nr:hypothetical protein [Pseudoalteromonas sp. NBT06-2]